MDNIDYESVSLLLHRAKDGCVSSRDELIDQLQSYLVVVANQNADQNLKHKLGTSDIVQQTVLNVIRGFEQFEGSNRIEFKAWLKQILINEIRNANRNFRRNKRDVTRERQLDYSENGIRRGLSDPDPTPQSLAEKAEMVVKMRSVMGLLSEDYQTVIQLRTFEKMTFAEIAERMGRSRDATAKLWYRAIVQLQNLMKEGSDG